MNSRFGIAFAVFVSAFGAFACEQRPSADSSVSTSESSTTGAVCIGTTASCPCESPGIEVSCGRVERRDGDYASCSYGTQKCGSDNRWTECVGDGIATKTISLSTLSNGLAPAALATSKTACEFNPCDQFCSAYVDGPVGVDAGSKFVSNDAGLGLKAADAGITGSTCTGLSPMANINMVVTAINPVTTSPTQGSFSTSLVPSGCLTSSLTPLWGTNRYDLGTVSTAGKYSHVVPVPASVTITAYAGSYSTAANVTVTVAADDVTGAPATYNVASFAGAVTSTEAASSIVYPYTDTIFPLGLSAPLVMWKRPTAATAARAVKVTLKFPATGTATFTYNAIVAEGATQRYQIPQSVWAAFDQTAKGSSGLITVQRIDSTNKLQTALSATVKFATANLRGRISYTNYGGAVAADVKQINPYGTAAPTSAFQPTLANNCGVCHSFSPSGNKFVTSSQGSSSNNGYNTFAISNVSSTGALTALHAGPAGAGDSRGLAYAAVTRTGTYTLLGNNWWGNVNGGVNATTPGTAGPAFKVYQLPTTAGPATDVSASGTGSVWGLGGATPAQMYTPTFSPDNNRLAFVNADTVADAAGAAGASRQGISTFNFDEAGKKFTNRKLLAKTTATGTPVNTYVRWPMWEIDSRSLMFQSSPKTVDDGFDWYAGMLPSGCCGRDKVKGQLFSMDAGPVGGTPNAPVALTKLNTGLGAASVWGTDDTNRNYQPTMLPVAVGGYRWAVFTSVRAYGNLLNTGTGVLSGMTNKLWVAAITDTTSGAVDRSNPAFFLPNQDASAGVLVERGYWTLDACKAPDVAASTCSSNEECCGYDSTTPSASTAQCVVDSPLASPPTFHCKSTSSAVCKAVGQSCSADSGCCGFPTTLCVSGTCQNPPAISTYTASTFNRDYAATCRPDQTLEWRFFDYKTKFPTATGSSITFTAYTAKTVAGLDTATGVLLATQTSTNATWLGANVQSTLKSATPKQTSLGFLRVKIAITPSTDGSSSPLLTDWRQAFDCIDIE